MKISNSVLQRLLGWDDRDVIADGTSRGKFLEFGHLTEAWRIDFLWAAAGDGEKCKGGNGQ